MQHFLLCLFLFALSFCWGQFTDDFSDADFMNNPSWVGDDSVFTIVDVSGNKRLRSNKTMPSTSFYLSTPSTLAQDGQWEFYTQLQFNTSSANYVDVYLTADQSNLLAANLNGYFVRIGGTTDEISLFKKINGVATKIIDGLDGTTNTSLNTIRVKVTCSSAGDWKLERDLTGQGQVYTQEGIINDVSLSTSSFFGVAITQSTASFILKHFFDDFYVGPIILDVTPPQLLSATTLSNVAIDVQFNEPLDPNSVQVLANYSFTPILTVQSAQLDVVDPTLVHLTLWPNGMTNGTAYQLTTTAVADVNGNISGSQTVNFSFLVADAPSKGDVIIHEFMCDPTPVVGLPEVEYIEIYNRSNKYFNVNGWKIGDASSEGTISDAWLLPGEYLVLCATANIDTFPGLSPIAVTSFPSLNNSGDNIVLKDNSGNELDKLIYDLSWYQSDAKADGGYSLELINPNDPCSAADNWKASASSTGGTPGAQNSVYDPTPDVQVPALSALIALPPNYLEIQFNEGMDSSSLMNAVYTFNPPLTVLNAFVASSGANGLIMQFGENLQGSQSYTVAISTVSDCWMNATALNGTFALPETAAMGDVVINEIVFDPITGGYDWVEIYNQSDKVIDLKDWQLANYDNDTIDNFKVVNDHFLLKPDGYAVLGKDSVFVLQNYPAAIPGTFVYVETPSYNIDSSTIFLLQGNQLMDKVSYAEDWHFSLLDNTDGVSLERINPAGPSGDRYNWHSAAEAIGFGTPGGKNSQYYPAVSNGEFHFTSSTVSPDSDGFEDILQVSYQMQKEGLLGTFTIYDDRGRKIRQLFQNELLATNGSFSWDGTTDDAVKASIGPYVAVFEAFGIDGTVEFSAKKVFVLAGKL